MSVYWGASDGFSERQMTRLPATGPHFFSYADIGDIYGRSSRYDYLSPPLDAGKHATFRSISWQADVPHSTRVEFQIRTASTIENLASARWRGPRGGDSFFRSAARLPELPAEDGVIQYKASLISPNSTNSPVLRSVSVGYVAGP